MPAGQFVKVVVPLYYQGHAYRAGSRIRVTIAAPNGTQPIWSFGQTVPSATGTVSIAFSTTMPSSLVLPVVPGVSVPTRAPAVPEPAQRALPALPGDREHDRRAVRSGGYAGSYGMTWNSMRYTSVSSSTGPACAVRCAKRSRDPSRLIAVRRPRVTLENGTISIESISMRTAAVAY